MTDRVVFERHHHTAVITLNRPDKLNACTAEMRDQLTAHLHDIAADHTVSAVVVTGRGALNKSATGSTIGGRQRCCVSPPHSAASERSWDRWSTSMILQYRQHQRNSSMPIPPPMILR